MAKKIIRRNADFTDKSDSHLWQEELASVISPIYEEVVTADTQHVLISNLDCLKHGGYHIECALYNPSGGAVIYYMYINGDYTDSHYRSQYINVDNATVTAGRLSSPNIGYATASQETIYSVIDLNVIYNSNSSGYDAKANVDENNGGGGNVVLSSRAWVYSNTVVDNITSIRISANAATGIGAGSVIRIWRKA